MPTSIRREPLIVAADATAGRILPAMISSTYQGFRTAPIPSGWVETGERWDLWWNGRSVANFTPAPGRGARVHLDARKIFQTKQVFAASVPQGRRYAERWRAARLYPEMPLRQAVAMLTDNAPIQPAPPPPGLPSIREQQQQARRLAEAGAKEVERIKEALEPRKPPVETKPRPRDARKAWVRAGRAQLRKV